jgi:hypothetical protein
MHSWILAQFPSSDCTRHGPRSTVSAACRSRTTPSSTDRPDFVESSQVVGKGRIQLETSVQWDRKRATLSTIRTLSTPTLLRIGLGDSTDCASRPTAAPCPRQRTGSPARARDRGRLCRYRVGIKWHLRRTSRAKAHLRWACCCMPTCRAAAANCAAMACAPRCALRPSGNCRRTCRLASCRAWASGQRRRGQARYGYGILAATLGKEFNERVRGFVELAAPQIARASHGGTQASFDTGLTWLVNKDLPGRCPLARPEPPHPRPVPGLRPVIAHVRSIHETPEHQTPLLASNLAAIAFVALVGGIGYLAVTRLDAAMDRHHQ